MCRDLSEGNIKRLVAQLVCTEWNFVYEFDLSEAWKLFIETIQECINNVCPLLPKTSTRHRLALPNYLLLLIRRKRCLWGQTRRNPNNANLLNEYH